MDTKAKRALFKALRAMKLGDFITVRGHRQQIDEVCWYEQDGEKWPNLIYHTAGSGSTEVALELYHGKLTLWFGTAELRGKFNRHPRILQLPGGETARVTEHRQKAKMEVTNKDGIATLNVVYSVYRGLERVRYTLEDWGEGIYIYCAQGYVAPEEVRVG